MLALAAMVGRSRELDAVLERLASAAAGAPCMVLVAGDAGVGKTRLVAEVVDHAAHDGWTVLAGDCLELSDGAVTLAPIGQVLRQLGDDRGVDGLARLLEGPTAGLARLVPELGIGHARSDTTPPVPAHVSFHRLLGELCGDQPVLLVVEDVHWADAATRDVLQHLAARVRGERLAVVATVRTDGLDRQHPIRPLLAELVRRPPVTRVDLRPLADAAMTRHLAGLTTREPDEARLAAVVARAEGNPFFAEQLLLGGRGDADLPPSLHDALVERLEQLPASARVLLGELAVLGGRADAALLETVASLDTATVRQVVRAAVDSGVLLVEGTGLRFQHALLGDVARGRLLPHERMAAHAAAARALEAGRGPAPPGLADVTARIAHHWRAAGDIPRGLAASVVAAEDALHTFAARDALVHARRAIELWDRVEDPEEVTGTSHPSLLLLALRAADAADDDGVRDLGAAAIRAATAAEDPETSAAAVQVMVRSLSSGGFERDALDVVSAELARQAGQRTPAAALVLSTHAEAVSSMAEVRAEAWDLAGVADELDRALEMARSTGDWYAEHRSLVGAAQTLGPYLPGRFDAAVSALLRLTEQPERLTARNTTHAVAAYVPYLCGDFTGTAAAIDRWRSFTADAGVAPLDWAGLWAMSLHLEVWSGRIGAALRQIRQVDIRDHEAAPNILTWLVALSGDPLRWTGETDRALEHAEFAVEVSPRGFATMPVAAELAASRAAAGATPHEVLAATRGIGASFGARNWHAYVPRLVEAVTAAANDAPVDERLVADVDGFVGRLDRYVAWLPHDAPVRPWATACLHRARAERAFLVGDPDPTLWDPVVADYDQRGGVPHAARARLRRATALAADGGGSSAACERDLRAALRTFDELELTALADDARSLARRLRIRVPRPSRPDGGDPLAELTERELDVVRLVARGWTNRQVGEHLFISAKTVSTHLSNLMRKLDVGSRTQAVLVVRDAGLVDEP